MSAAELAALLAAHVPAETRALLDQAAAIAAAQGQRIYLVGGPVRDLILGQPLTDVDLVVAGDAWSVADAFAALRSGKLTHHAAFRTATVELLAPEPAMAIDFVTARREDYPAPAALPVITPADMPADLQRRDFSINALALELVPGGAGELLDPFMGATDIAAGHIRVLHARSFVDDPTRILRAARFAARFGFTVEPNTRGLLEQAIADQLIARTSPQRILNEIWLLLAEPYPEQALALLHTWGALPQLELAWSTSWASHFAKLRAAELPAALLRTAALGCLIWPLDAAGRARFGRRYNLPTPERRLLAQLPLTVPAIMAAVHPDPVQLEHELGSLSIAALAVLEAVAPPGTTAALRRLHEISRTPPLLTGADLQAAGIPAGPHYRTILADVRAAQVRGTLTTRDEALQWVRTIDVGALRTAVDE